MAPSNRSKRSRHYSDSSDSDSSYKREKSSRRRHKKRRSSRPRSLSKDSYLENRDRRDNKRSEKNSKSTFGNWKGGSSLDLRSKLADNENENFSYKSQPCGFVL